MTTYEFTFAICYMIVAGIIVGFTYWAVFRGGKIE